MPSLQRAPAASPATGGPLAQRRASCTAYTQCLCRPATQRRPHSLIAPSSLIPHPALPRAGLLLVHWRRRVRAQGLGHGHNRVGRRLQGGALRPQHRQPVPWHQGCKQLPLQGEPAPGWRASRHSAPKPLIPLTLCPSPPLPSPQRAPLLPQVVKIAPALKYVPPPPKAPVTNLKAIVQNATATQQTASKALTAPAGNLAGTPTPVVSAGSGAAPERAPTPVHMHATTCVHPFTPPSPKPFGLPSLAADADRPCSAQANTTVSRGSATRTDTAQVVPNTGSTSKVQNSSGNATYTQVGGAGAGDGAMLLLACKAASPCSLAEGQLAGQRSTPKRTPFAGAAQQSLTAPPAAVRPPQLPCR
jgi:hypothetical protein